jgi:hypothetical protein
MSSKSARVGGFSIRGIWMLGGAANAALTKNSTEKTIGASWKRDRRGFTMASSILYVKLVRGSEETHNVPSAAEQLDAANGLSIAPDQSAAGFLA